MIPIYFLVRHPIERLLSAYRDRFGNILTIKAFIRIYPDFLEENFQKLKLLEYGKL